MTRLQGVMKSLNMEIKIVQIDGSKRVEVHAPLFRRKINLLTRWYSLDYPDHDILTEAEEYVAVNYLRGIL